MPCKQSEKSSGFCPDILVKKNRVLLILVLLFSLALFIPASQVGLEDSGVSFTNTDAEKYENHQDFIQSFGKDDYILLAVKSSLPISDPEVNSRIIQVHEALNSMESVLEVIDLSSIQGSDLPQTLSFDTIFNTATIHRFYSVIPGLARMISNDFKTLAFIVKINNEKINGFAFEKRLNQMKQIIGKAFPEYPHCYAVGIPVLRSAFERYNLMNALFFGALGLFFGMGVALYIFKTPGPPVMVMTACINSLVWTLGFMGIFNISLNLATGLSFGFILITTATLVIHIVSKYMEIAPLYPGSKALIKTLEIVLRPCLMCSLTTAAGFLSLTISPVAMVREAGIIIAFGVILSFILTTITTCFYLLKFPGSLISHKSKPDYLEKFRNTHMTFGFKKPEISLFLGIIFLIFIGLGIPEIQSVKHLTTPMIKSTQESLDMDYVEKNISTGHSFSLVFKDKENQFHSKKFWYDLYQLEKQIKSLEGIQGIDSLTPFVFHLAMDYSSGWMIMPELIFKQILSKTPDLGLLRSYIDPGQKDSGQKKLRIIIHMQADSSAEMETTLEKITRISKETMAENMDIYLSGQMILLRTQTSELVSSQLKTLVLALVVITLLIIVQLKSFLLGLMSLVPNIFPMVTIFGLMGWLDIPLDPLTIFAAVISFGLSVDDSIHYLTQLKREVTASGKTLHIDQCLKKAYQVTSRALISTTAVLFLASLALLFSSFNHVFSLGLLISSASLAALIGDLVLLPAAVLAIQPFNHLFSLKLKP
jgi:predicted RND superfamily exporter protein